MPRVSQALSLRNLFFPPGTSPLQPLPLRDLTCRRELCSVLFPSATSSTTRASMNIWVGVEFSKHNRSFWRKCLDASFALSAARVVGSSSPRSLPLCDLFHYKSINEYMSWCFIGFWWSLNKWLSEICCGKGSKLAEDFAGYVHDVNIKVNTIEKN